MRDDSSAASSLIEGPKAQDDALDDAQPCEDGDTQQDQMDNASRRRSQGDADADFDPPLGHGIRAHAV